MRKQQVKDPFDIQFNKNAKAIRKALKLTQEEVAVCIPVKRTSIGSWEEQRAGIPTCIKFNICELFHVDFAAMHTGEIDVSQINIVQFYIERRKRMSR